MKKATIQIEVRRQYVESRVKKYKSGRIETIPAYYVCRYYYGGKEIARYDSQENLLRLRTELIKNDFSLSCFERAIQGDYSNAYRQLFDLLNIDKESAMSEYMFGPCWL